MAVFVLDRFGKPLMPCSEKRARLLLSSGRARIHRVVPFVIRLVDRKIENSSFQPLTVSIDPGSKTTGLSLIRPVETVSPESGEVTQHKVILNLFELIHRGHQISESLTARSNMRRRRRGTLRYRQPRFNNRTKPKGWLAPSLQHRVNSTLSWINRFIQWTPITQINCELVRFDLQKIQNPDISGIEYNQGTLFGYEVREYLLEKFNRQCVYCDVSNVPLQIEHIQPKSKGGSNRISNLALACQCCNQKKNSQNIQEFLEHDKLRLNKIMTQVKAPFKDAAAVNATRWTLVNTLKDIGLPVLTASGGQTKFNRIKLNLPKTHAIDSVCVGQTDSVSGENKPTLTIKSMGRGSYQRTRLDKYGFPRGYLMRNKSVYGFQTGDRVCANVLKGKKAGIYTGRVAVRASGSFNIQTVNTVIQGISYKYCKIIQRADGYLYNY